MKLKKAASAVVRVFAYVTILERSTKRLYQRVKPHLSWNLKTKSSEELVDEFYSIRREHFLTEGVIYFVSAAYIMEGSQDVRFRLGGAIFLLIFAVLLFYLSFYDRPPRLADSIQFVTSAYRTVPFFVFVGEFLAHISALLNTGITTWFVTPYFYIGLLLFLFIGAQQIFEEFRSRKRKRAARKN